MSKILILSLIIFIVFIQINKCTETDFDIKLRNKRFLKTLQEKLDKSQTKGNNLAKRRASDDKLDELKGLLLKLLDKIDSYEEKGEVIYDTKSGLKLDDENEILLNKTKSMTRRNRRRRKKKQSKKNRFTRQQHWGKWTDWSSCSVTCGKGREIRWRHCLADRCDEAETEMEEKTCQMPACAGKLFGIFKL